MTVKQRQITQWFVLSIPKITLSEKALALALHLVCQIGTDIDFASCY